MVISPSFAVFVPNFVQLTKNLTGLPATIQDVSMQNMNQTWISWNLGI
jgi:hypothetical protein